MKRIFKSTFIFALVAVMMFPAFSMMASAAEYDEYTRTIYFIDNKEWGSVSAYTWSEEDGAEVAFPGEKLTKVGTTDLLTETYDVYALEVDKDDDYVVFNQGFEHGQQSSDIDLRYPWGGTNIIYLDQNNKAMVCHFFDTDRLTPVNADTAA